MFYAIWEFALSADSASLESASICRLARFLGMHCALWEFPDSAALSGKLQCMIESRNLPTTLDNLIIRNIKIRYTSILPVVYHVSL